MKRFLGAAALALVLALAAYQEASAWCNTRFTIGLDTTWQSGNNSWLWGFATDGQVPGYPTDVRRPRGGHHGQAGCDYGAPMFDYSMPGVYGAPDFGAAPGFPVPGQGIPAFPGVGGAH